MPTNLIPQNIAYSLNQPLSSIFNPPFVANRAPGVNDQASIGQVWIFPANNAIYVLTSITGAAQYNWQLLEVGGGGGVFANLTVNPGPTNLTGALTVTSGANAVNIGNDNAAGAINIGTAGFRQIDIGSAAAAGFDIEASGASTIQLVNANLDIIVGTGTVNISDDATNNAVNLATGAGNKAVTIGSATGTSSITVLAGTGAAQFAANGTQHATTVGSTNGTSTTTIQSGTNGIALTGPLVRLNALTNLYVGAGAPGNGLALEAGDLYIRTDPAGATSRMYIATGAGAWTNITCAT
jgi:hypothetical protein